MKAAWLALGVLLVSAIVLTSREDQPAPEGCLGRAQLAAYEWRTDMWRDLVVYSAALDRFAATCATRLYIDVTRAALVDGADSDQLADDVRALAAEARVRGIELAAVAGDPWWPTTPDNPDVRKILAFVAELQAPEGPLAAVHLDAEPWGLDEWHSDRVDLTADFLDYTMFVQDLRTELGLTIPLGHLVPYWFDGSTDAAVPVTWRNTDAYPLAHLAGHLGQETDLVVMAYRDRATGPGGIIDLASEELAAGEASTSIGVRIGLETGPIDPSTASFHGQSHDAFLSEALAVVEATGVSEIVVNDAASLIELSQ